MRQRRASASSTPSRFWTRLSAEYTARRSLRLGGAPRARRHAPRARRAARASRPERAAAIPSGPRPPTGMPSETSRSAGTEGSFTRTARSPSTRMTSPAWAGAAASRAAATASVMVRGYCRIRGTTRMAPKGCGVAHRCAPGRAGRLRQTRRVRNTPPTILPGVRRLAFLLLLAACLLAACGGDEDTDDVENLLDRAFSEEIQSADLKLDAEIEMTGLLEEPIRIEAEGPFRSNEEKLPSADIELRIGSDGGGQTDHERRAHDRGPGLREVPGRVLRAAARRRARGERGDPQEQRRRGQQATQRARSGPALMARRGRGGGRRGGGRRGDPPRVRHARRGEPDAQPEPVRRALGLGARRRGRAARSAAPERSRHPRADRGRSGPELRRLRRQGGRHHPARVGPGGVRDPEAQPGRARRPRRRVDRVLGGVPGRERRAGDRGTGQRAPAVGPDDSLGAGGLAGGLGGGAGQPDAPGPPDMPSGGVGDGASDPEAFRRYAECLDKARPEDTEELQRCADLLERP